MEVKEWGWFCVGQDIGLGVRGSMLLQINIRKLQGMYLSIYWEDRLMNFFENNRI